MESVNLDYNRFAIQQITLPKPIQPLCFTFHGFIKVSKRICNIFSGKGTPVLTRALKAFKK